MKQLTVISGKGGTGKTSITAALASLAKDNAVFADCDVDAADLHLILKPRIKKTMSFHGLKIAVIDKDKCIDCKICYEHCRFNAIDENINVIKDRCEGCSVCSYVCPTKAISMEDRTSGFLYISETRFGPMSHAILKTAEEASGKLVTAVRENAKKLALEEKKDLIIIDGPPGIGCPVISAITGVDLVLIVTEPTLSAIHDLERILGVAQHFKIPARKFLFEVNGIDPLFFAHKPESSTKIREILGIQESDYLLLIIARLVNWKGIHKAVNVLPELKAQLNNKVHLVVLGYGPLKSELLALASKLGVADNLHLMGAVSHKELPLYIDDADIFLSLQDYSNLSNGLLEALARGKCIITLNDGSLDSFIGNKVSEILVLIDPDNMRVELPQKIVGLLKNHQIKKKYEQSAKEFAQNRIMTIFERSKIELEFIKKAIAPN